MLKRLPIDKKSKSFLPNIEPILLIKQPDNQYSIYILLVPIILITGWLILENHGFYGDEAAHLGFLFKALEISAKKPDFLRSLWSLYKFNDSYPPLFYILSIPFVVPFSNYLLGARVFVALLYLLASFLTYKILRQFVSLLGVVVGILCLCSSPFFLQAGRYYILEILVLVFILAVILELLAYLKTGLFIHLILAGLFIAGGMLTKYNFVIYILPILLIFFIVLFVSIQKAHRSLREIALAFFTLAIPSILIASPWYIFFVFGKHQEPTVIRSLFSSYFNGQIKPVNELATLLLSIGFQYRLFFPRIVIWFFFFLSATIAVGFLFKRHVVTAQVFRFEKPKVWIWFFIFIAVYQIVLTLTITVLVGGDPALFRWNLSYAFFPVFIGFLVDFFQIRFRRALSFGISIILILVIPSWYIVNVIPLAWISPFGGANYLSGVLLPKSATTGSAEVMSLIKKDINDRHINSTVIIGIAEHVHSGFHGNNFRLYFYKDKINAILITTGILTPDKPAEPTIFLRSDYIAFIPGYIPEQDDQFQYQWVVDRLPQSYMQCLESIGIVPSRYGKIMVNRVDKKCLSPKVDYDISEVGKQFNEADGSSMILFWEVEQMRARLQMSGEANASEMDQDYLALQKRVENAKNGLSPYLYSLLEEKFIHLKSNWISLKLNGAKNLLESPGFEAVDDPSHPSWHLDPTTCILDKTGEKSYSGKSAVFALGEEAQCFQILAVEPDTEYLLGQYTRSETNGAEVRIQINWLDEGRQLANFNIKLAYSSPYWEKQTSLVKSPANAKYGIIYLTPQGNGQVWFDEMFLYKLEK